MALGVQTMSNAKYRITYYPMDSDSLFVRTCSPESDLPNELHIINLLDNSLALTFKQQNNHLIVILLTI